MEESEYRWHQRLKNFSKAWKLLKEAIDLSHTRELNELEDQGLIHRFEFAHKIDLSLFRHIENPGLREHIEKTDKIVYQKDPDRIHHEINQ